LTTREGSNAMVKSRKRTAMRANKDEGRLVKHALRCLLITTALLVFDWCNLLGVNALSFPTRRLAPPQSFSSRSLLPPLMGCSGKIDNVRDSPLNMEMTKCRSIEREARRGLFKRRKNDRSFKNGALSSTSIAFFLLRSIFAITSAAVAFTTAPVPRPISLVRKISIPSLLSRRKIVILVASLLSVASLIDLQATRKRLSIDETSEWTRYSNNPSRRGRALTFLLLRITPYILIPSILSKMPRANQTRIQQLKSKGGALFADGLLRLGPLYIKIGQILSCRDKLLPPEWINAMEKLQDRVPAKSGQEAMDLAYQAFNQSQQTFHQTFTFFDNVPIAAASLGQVHKAIYNNQTVAIKIQRPNLRQIYDQDLSLMQSIASFVDKFLSGSAGSVGGVEQSWSDIFADAESILYREIDYRDEADNAIRFAQDFGIGLNGNEIPPKAKALDGEPLPSAASWLRTPYVYQDLSSEQFLVMEYVPSIKISNDEALTKNNVTQDDRIFLAESLARSYLRQFCIHQFFSTDPHPGNLGVEVRPNLPPRLVFYDFGQACFLSGEQSNGILDVIEGIKDLDAKCCVKAFDRMGVLKENADLNIVERKVQSNFDTGKIKLKKRKISKISSSFAASSPLDQQQFLPQPPKSHLSKTLNNDTTSNSTANTTHSDSNKQQDEVSDKDVMPFFTLPAEYAFVARALSQMDGVGKSLDSDFDFISASAPYLVEIKGAKNYLKDEAVKFVRGWQEAGILWQKRLFKKSGFDPSKYRKKENRKE